MIKLKRYLKPFALSLLLAVVLLFVQAACDLNLPSYMARIVNVGIQQNGIENGFPEAISKEGFEFMGLFMSEAERAVLDKSYTLKTSEDMDKNGKPYSKQYPKANQLYVLNFEAANDKETAAALENAFGSGAWTLINIMKSMDSVGRNPESGSMSSSDIDISQLYKAEPMLKMLPAEAFQSAKEQALALDGVILIQGGTLFASVFYKELGVDMGAYQSSFILKVGLLMLLIALVSGIATILVSFLSSKIASGLARDLRNDIFKKVENFGSAEFDRFSTASLITRTTNDTTQIRMFLAIGIRMLCYAPIMGIGGIVMALNKSTSMGWIIALACIVLVGLIATIFSLVIPKFKAMQKFIDRLNLVARETLNGLMVIRAFGTDEFEKKRFSKANRDLAKTDLFVNRTMTFMMPAMMLIMNGVSVLIVWVGSHQVAESAMQVGDMMAFMQYAMQIIMSFLMVSMMFIFIPRASVSGARIAEVLEVTPAINDPENPKQIVNSKKGYVEFKNVSFKYEGAEDDVLKSISFVAKPGQTTAFIGSTGSGKSTLISLIPRFYDVTSGEVLVGGVNVKDMLQKELRCHIGYVPQKSVLMSGTIASNIKYGNQNSSDSEMTEAAAVAQALTFINEKKDGFESEIAQGGSNVSGGQKQRLSIARALAVNPDIYIFDDSFSALDFKTDAELRAALKTHTGGSTVIIVTQRVSTIMDAEQIFVIDDGEIVGHGQHKELLKSCPAYYEIAASQLEKENL